MIEWGLMHRLNINFWCLISGVCSVAIYLHAFPQASYGIQTFIASHKWHLRERKASFTQTMGCFVGFENFHRMLCSDAVEMELRSSEHDSKVEKRYMKITNKGNGTSSRVKERNVWKSYREMMPMWRCDAFTHFSPNKQQSNKMKRQNDKTKAKNMLEKKRRRKKNMKWNEINREIIWKFTHTQQTL